MHLSSLCDVRAMGHILARSAETKLQFAEGIMIEVIFWWVRDSDLHLSSLWDACGPA